MSNKTLYCLPLSMKLWHETTGLQKRGKADREYTGVLVLRWPVKKWKVFSVQQYQCNCLPEFTYQNIASSTTTKKLKCINIKYLKVLFLLNIQNFSNVFEQLNRMVLIALLILSPILKLKQVRKTHQIMYYAKHQSFSTLLLLPQQLHGSKKTITLYALTASKCLKENFIMNYVFFYMGKLHNELLEMKSSLIQHLN